MKNLTKKSITIVLMVTILMLIFMPTMVKAASIGRVGSGKRVTFTEKSTDSTQLSSSTNIAEYIDARKEAFAQALAANGVEVDLNHSNIDPNTLFSTSEPYKFATVDSIESGYMFIDESIIQVYTVNYKTVNVTIANNSSLTRRTVVNEYIARPYDTEEVPYDTDLEAYTASKLWGSSDARWVALFGCVNGVWQYPAKTGETWEFVEQEVTDTEIINKYNVTYDQVIVTKADAPSTAYSITDGNNQTFTLGETNDIKITADGDLSKLAEIKVNNSTLDSSNYELESGSTILTLKNEYLNTLSAGAYTVQFVYDDGSVDANLTIEEAKDDNKDKESTASKNPKTGDNIAMWISILVVSLLGATGTVKSIFDNVK